MSSRGSKKVGSIKQAHDELLYLLGAVVHANNGMVVIPKIDRVVSIRVREDDGNLIITEQSNGADYGNQEHTVVHAN